MRRPDQHTVALRTAVALLSILVVGCGGLKLGRAISSGEWDWPTFARTIERTNATPEQLRPPLALKWEYDISAGMGNGSPLIIDSVVFVGNLRGELHAINRLTGKRLGWADFGEAIHGAPIFMTNIALIASSNTRASLVAYDLSDGTTRWRKEYGDIETSPLLHAQRVYFGNTAGTFFCVSRDKGETIWTFELPNNTRRKGIRSSPAADGSSVVFGADDGAVYALDMESGTLRWRFDAGAPVLAPVAMSDGRVFVGTLAGQFHALDASTGHRAWSATPGSPIYAAASIGNNAVIVGTASGDLTAWDPTDGRVKWTRNLDAVISAAGAIAGDILYIGTLKKRLHAINIHDGGILWEEVVPGRIKTSPAIARGTLVVATDERLVLAFEQDRP